MRLVVQRVKNASVKIDGVIYNKINYGYLIYVCFLNGDTGKNLDRAVDKILNLRIMKDSFDKMNNNILSVQNSEILLISQFTLAGDAIKSNRPSFVKSLDKDLASKLYLDLLDRLNKKIPTKPGIFASDMEVESVNDGPVTIIIEMENIW